MSSSNTTPTSSNTSLHRPLHDTTTAPVGLDASHATATGSGNASRSPKNTASFTASTEHIAGSLSTGSASSPPPATPSTASPPATRPGVTPITGRLRSSSRSSGSTPTFSKLNKRYNQHGTSYGPHSRSKSSVPAPKVLPFPDLSSRIGTSSRDGSRPTSPTHVHSASHTPPHATPRGSSTDVTLSGMLGLPPGTTLSRRNSSLALSPPRTAGQAGGGSIGMMAGNSWDGRTAGESASRRTSGGATGSPQADSSSPVPAAGRSTPIVFSASRPRAQTGPVSARPNVVSPGPVPILRTETISPPPSPAPQARAARTTPIPIPGGARFALSSTPPPPPIEKDLPEPARGKKAPSINRDAPAQVGSASVAITPAPATQPLADHLYVSFLQGECADVRLWVRRWGVAWKVHKIVLVQAGFFNSLFLGGFSENRHPDVRVASRKGKERAGEIEDDWKGENVELQFDDPNITRAAFEICLSRLYSPHPRLHFPSLLLPTPALPLTPAFPIAPSLSEPLLAARDGLPEHAQLATPRTLLSLLATSIYLGYNPLVREVMAMVLRTVSPCSVGRYLGFAIGDGIGEEEWDGQDDEAAYGLEHVAQVLPERLDSSTVPRKSNRHSHSNTSPRKTSFTHRDSTASDGKHEDDVKVGSAPSQEKLHRAAGSARPSAQNASAEGAHDADASIDPDETIRVDQSLMPHFYGSISNKIGEAAVCWLSRWALDLLHVELAISVNHVEKSEESWRIFAYGGIPSRFIRALLSSDSFFVRSEMERYRVARAILDLRRSGFEADMNGPDQPSDRDAGDVGQSTLLDKVVKEEDEDDSASQREAEMWEAWDEEEGEMMRIFAEGVYYSHMSFEDLSEIARDIDPQTHLPYAPLPVLQAAHWAAADLKARINAHENALADESAVEDQDTSELGLAISTEDLANISARSTRRITSRGRLSSAALSVPGFRTPPRTADAANSSASIASAASAFGLGNPSDHAIYHPIPGDDTFRSGAGGLLFQPTAVTATSPIPGIPGIPDLCGPTNGSGDNEDGGKKRAPPQGENSFFGLSATSKTALQIAARTPDPTYGLSGAPTTLAERWSKTEPFRFSVEFWGVDQLAEKERLYSTTHFHAGSYWNVYVQTIRKKDKGTQLGIYLHRQSKTEGFPPPSCPPVAMQNEVEEAYEGISRSTQAERRREGVLEGYGQASAPAAGTRDRGREGRSMSEGGSDRTVIARRGRSNDYANDRDGLHRYDDQRAVLPRTGSVAANLGAETLSRSLGPAGSSANLATSYGSPSTGLLHQSLRSPNNGEVSASRHRAQPSSISSTSAVLGLGTSSRAAMHRASTSTDMRRTSSSLEDDPQATYRDARRVTKAYFSITCASALGTALIRFSSSPDSFTLSQSWGWKSSALRSEEYLASSSARGLDGGAEAHMVDLQGPDGPDGVKGWHGMLLDPPASIGLEPREIGGSGSLRATVVVGII